MTINSLQKICHYDSPTFTSLLNPFDYSIQLPGLDGDDYIEVSGPMLTTLHYFHSIKEMALHDDEVTNAQKDGKFVDIPSPKHIILGYLTLFKRTHSNETINIENVKGSFNEEIFQHSQPAFADYISKLFDENLPKEEPNTQAIQHDLSHLATLFEGSHQKRTAFLEPITELHKRRTLSITNVYFKHKMNDFTARGMIQEPLKSELASKPNEESRINHFVNTIYLSENSHMYSRKNRKNQSFCSEMAIIHQYFTTTRHWNYDKHTINFLPNPLTFQPRFGNFRYWLDDVIGPGNAAMLTAYLEYLILVNAKPLIVGSYNYQKSSHTSNELAAAGLFNQNLFNLDKIIKKLDEIKQHHPLAIRSRQIAFALLHDSLDLMVMYTNSMLDYEINAAMNNILAPHDLSGLNQEDRQPYSDSYNQAIYELKFLINDPLFMLNAESFIDTWANHHVRDRVFKHDKTTIQNKIRSLIQQCHTHARRYYNFPLVRYFASNLQKTLIKLIQSDPKSIEDIYSISQVDDYGAPLNKDPDIIKSIERLHTALQNPSNNTKHAIIQSGAPSPGYLFRLNEVFRSLENYLTHLRQQSFITLPLVNLRIPISIQQTLLILGLALPLLLCLLNVIAFTTMMFSGLLSLTLMGILNFHHIGLSLDSLEYSGRTLWGLGQDRMHRIIETLKTLIKSKDINRFQEYIASFKPQPIPAMTLSTEPSPNPEKIPLNQMQDPTNPKIIQTI